MPRRTTAVLAAAALLLAALDAGALDLKLGSIAPRGSPWELALKKIAGEWERLSSGQIDLRLYGGGIAGGENDIIRKVRIGQLQAALLTMSGLQTIWKGLKALSYPLFIRDEVEFDRVLEALQPTFDRELQARGFTVLFWSTGGWLYFFTRQPVIVPDDLRRQRLWVTGDPDEMQAWQAMGFQVVPLAATEVLTSLQGGMIDGMIASPLVAASNQWFGIASRMCRLKLSPLYGALVVSSRSWDEVPAALRPKMLAAARAAAAELPPVIARADSEAVTVMLRNGLKITDVPDRVRPEWEEVIRRGFSLLIGTAYDASAYEAAKRVLEDYRASLPAR